MGVKKRVAALLIGGETKISTAEYRYATGNADIGFPTIKPVTVGGYEVIPDNIVEFPLIEPVSYALIGYSIFGNWGKGLRDHLKHTLSGSGDVRYEQAEKGAETRVIAQYF